jgi:hypothetical protein
MSDSEKETRHGEAADVEGGEDASPTVGSNPEVDLPASGNGISSGELDLGPDAIPIRLNDSPLPNRYREMLREQSDTLSEDGSSVDNAPRRVISPIDSMLSAPEDVASHQVRCAASCSQVTPVLTTSCDQGSAFSSPGSSVLPSLASRTRLESPTPSLQPFDRRFRSRISPSSPGSSMSRPSSPAAFMYSHSRNASLSSQLLVDPTEADASSPPWDVVRWMKLRKLGAQVFSESGRRNFGSPTCFAISSTIALGTAKGIVLVFDYSQNLKVIIGPGTKG